MGEASSAAPAPTVLFVEDDENLRLLGRRRLEAIGLNVVEAGDAAGALELYIQQPPALVLLDVGLPDRSGLEVCGTIRAMPDGEEIPILMLTGLGDSETIAEAYQAGATDFAVKPANWTVLANRIQYMVSAGLDRQRLLASRSKLAKTERIAHLGTWELELGRRRLSWSAETGRILGLPESGTAALEELIERVHPLDRARVTEAFDTAVTGQTEIDVDHRLLCSDGSIRMVHHRAEIRRDQGGRAVAIHGVTRDVTDRRRTEERVKQLANYDLLTGLPNRHMFLELLRSTLARGERNDSLSAVVYLDLDRFKTINDTLGPEAGDELLTSVADRLRVSLRRSDYIVREPGPTVARWGGDKFLILVSDLESVRGAARATQRLLNQLSIPFTLRGEETFLTASAGIAVHPPDAQSAFDLLQHAESAMYHAKEAGRNRFQFYSEWMNSTSTRKMEIERHLHRAVELNELSLAFQPLLSCADLEVVGAEALVRWTNAKLGLVPPDEFIPIAEEIGVIEEIGEWVLRTACARAVSWAGLTGFPERLAVNVSTHQLRERNFVGLVERILDETGLDPERLDLELTERGVTLDDARSAAHLQQLRTRGVRIAIDDFGTGNSALSYLKAFPLDLLKIDRSFVRGIQSGGTDAAIISAVIAMAHRLGFEVVAEGLESEAQLRFLAAERCDYVQGFLFAKPLPAEEFSRMCRSGGFSTLRR